MSPAEASPPARHPDPEGRFFVLDGWRAISILLVLAAHMLPLGPKALRLNETAGYMGMSLFFTLSGFLITTQVHRDGRVGAFFIRRLFRIVPLAWLGVLVAAYLADAGARGVLTSLFFGQTYSHAHIIPGLSHFWSLCVEVHFYLFIGVVLWLGGARIFQLLPFVWAALFLLRSSLAPSGTIETHLRVDEILSGSLLALLHLGKLGDRTRGLIVRAPVPLLLLVLLATCLPVTAPVHGFRGLAAAAVVGHTLFAGAAGGFRWLGARPLRYIAAVSYALYVIHPFSMHGWLGQGATPAAKYAKRLLCLAITFALAHLSTFAFERRFIAWAKVLTARSRTDPSAGRAGSHPLAVPVRPPGHRPRI